MAGTLGVIALLVAVAFAIGSLARLLDRRIPALVLASFFVLACLPFPRAFVTEAR